MWPIGASSSLSHTEAAHSPVCPHRQSQTHTHAYAHTHLPHHHHHPSIIHLNPSSFFCCFSSPSPDLPFVVAAARPRTACLCHHHHHTTWPGLDLQLHHPAPPLFRSLFIQHPSPPAESPTESRPTACPPASSLAFNAAGRHRCCHRCQLRPPRRSHRSIRRHSLHPSTSSLPPAPLDHRLCHA